MDVSEIPVCAEDLHFQYGDLAAFSVTSAATDLATFISKYTNGASTTVYGVSYGTVFVGRLLHLAPPEVTGYVLDSVGTTSGAPGDEFFFMSKWDAFISLCEEDKACKARFEPEGLNNTLWEVIRQFDNDPNSTCASMFNSLKSSTSIESPSFALRQTLATLVKDTYLRTLIPPIVYRLSRCGPEDIDILNQFVVTVRTNTCINAKTQDSAFESKPLNALIVFSEMWEIPTPSTSELKAPFTKSTIADGVYETGNAYCAFSKEKSAACDKLGVGTYDADGIIYERDQYWNKTVTIPSGASILLLSEKLDAHTPHKYTEFLFNVLDGDNKELITFEYGSHGIVTTTHLIAGDPWSETCGMKMLASYVRNSRDLESLDKACVADMPPFNQTTPDSYLTSYLGTDDAYDGKYNWGMTPTTYFYE